MSVENFESANNNADADLNVANFGKKEIDRYKWLFPDEESYNLMSLLLKSKKGAKVADHLVYTKYRLNKKFEVVIRNGEVVTEKLSGTKYYQNQQLR